MRLRRTDMLAQRMREQNMSVTELAERVGKSRQFIHRLLRGDATKGDPNTCRLETGLDIEEELAVPFCWLFDLEKCDDGALLAQRERTRKEPAA